MSETIKEKIIMEANKRKLSGWRRKQFINNMENRIITGRKK